MVRERRTTGVVVAAICAVVATLACALSASTTRAGGPQTFVVTLPDNAINVPDGVCDAACTLQDAIIAHNNNSTFHNTITFDPAAFPLGDGELIIPFTPLDKIRAESGVTIDATSADVTIAGFEMSPGGPGLEFTSQPGVPIRDVVVRNLGFYQMPDYNIYVCPAPTADIVFPCGYDISNLLFEDLRFDLAEDAGVLVRGVAIEGVTVRGSTAIDSTTGEFISIFGRAVSDVTIEDNSTTNSGSILVHAIGTGAGGVDVSNVTIAGNTLDGEQIWVLGHGLRNLEITANQVANSIGNGIGVTADDVRNAEISDNEVIGVQSAGIGIFSPFDLQNVEISDNKLTDNGDYGIHIDNQFGASAGVVIKNNEIRENLGPGIAILRGGPIRISENRISNNQDLGIDLGNNGVTFNDAGDSDSGPNGLLNFPEWEGGADACPGCRVEIFLSDPDPSGFGEGQEFVAAVTADLSGDFLPVLCAVDLIVGTKITATATDLQGNTSEFSPNYTWLGTEPCPTPTPSPTASPSPTLTPTPSVTPTTSPTPSATESPGVTATSTPTSSPGGEAEWGDSDCSGNIGARDNQALLREVLDQTPLSQTEPCPDIGSQVGDHVWGDWDCSGAIGARDNQALLRFVLDQPPLSQTEPCPDIGSSPF